MRTLNQTLDQFELQYALENIAPVEKLLFLDIETTGFTARSSTLYMIGVAYCQKATWHIRQWFAENPSDEKQLLEEFFDFACNFTHLVHFNGNNFDLPYLLQKFEQHSLSYSFNSFEGIDIFKRISPYKFFLNTPNCKQKTLENLMHIEREDKYSGGDLISIYYDYLKNNDEELRRLLLLHNSDDMRGMLEILPLLSFYDLFNKPLTVKKVQANHYNDYYGIARKELLMKIELPSPLPFPVSNFSNGCYFSGEGNSGILKVPVFEEEMKYFYGNYKDYYYLPSEDTALHKSVATFVEKEHRTQATASTCYTRKYSLFLPQWEVIMEPFFRRDYSSKDYFFELTDELKTDRTFFCKYAQYLLVKMANTY